MPIIRALSLFLAGAMAVAGQELNLGPQKSNVKPSDLCSVEGIAVKSTTGEGIKRVTVQLSPIGAGEHTYSAITESNGHFILRDVAPGRYAISASGNGYMQQVYERGKGNLQDRILDLTPGKNVSGLAFRLVPPAVITGTIYDEDGDPVVQAQVRALRVVGSGARRQVGEGGSGETNDLGQYRIWGLQPGKYLVAASYKPPLSDQGQTSDQTYLPTLHPSTPEASQASVVEVAPGAESSGIDVDLRQAHAVAVRGRVMVEGSAKPTRNVFVSLNPRVAQGSFSFQNYGAMVQGASGDFEIRGVPPGSYNIIAFWNDGNRQLGARVPVDVGSSNVDGVIVLLASPIPLAGRFRVEGGDQFDFTRLGLVLQSIDPTTGSPNAEIKPDGTFQIQNVYDGSYRVRVLGYPEGYYLKSVREGGSEVLESGLTIIHSQPPSHLEITLSPDGGRVEGTVLHEQRPVSGAWVVLAPDAVGPDREDMSRGRVTDSFGRFSLLGLPPGDFKLFAWEPVQGTDYSDPDFLGGFEGRGTRVHIEEKQQQKVQLEVITAEDQLR